MQTVQFIVLADFKLIHDRFHHNSLYLFSPSSIAPSSTSLVCQDITSAVLQSRPEGQSLLTRPGRLGPAEDGDDDDDDYVEDDGRY